MTKNVRRQKPVHNGPIGRLSPEVFQKLCGVFGLTYSMSHSDATTFAGANSVRPVGEIRLVVMSYMPQNERRQAWFRGFRGVADATTGYVHYGNETAFVRDYGRPPRSRGDKYDIDPVRQGDLLDMADWLHQMIVKRTQQIQMWRLSAKPSLPLVLLAFENQPVFQDLPELRKMACAKTRIPSSRLNKLSELDRTTMLYDLWQSQLREPRSATNPTDYWLIDARLVSRQPAIAVYEDLRGDQFWIKYGDDKQLVSPLGIPVFNPVRDVLKNACRPNPAAAILRQNAFDPTAQAETHAALMTASDAQFEKMVAEMRQSLGEGGEVFLDAELIDAISNWDKPIPLTTQQLVDNVVVSRRDVATQLRAAGQSRVLAEMRALVPKWLQRYVTEEDLQAAALAPNDPLVVLNAPRMQLCVQQACAVSAAYSYPRDVLGAMTSLELWPSELLQRQSPPKPAAVPEVAQEV